MQIIKLNNQEWQVDINSPLGSPGGFGEVFHGEGKDGEVAIKRLKLTASQAAHRELQIGEALSERKLNNVVPILDFGQDADSDRYFIVMPICDQSLQDRINEIGSFSNSEAISVLLSILSGLKEVQDITHRDLKPSNVLLHKGIWKIADFGIAKFVEDSTSLETLRSSLTPAYAAPEQWNIQRPTSATDIYAVGCITYALITGNPPFVGDVDTLRDQHINKTPPTLNELPANARSLISIMLRKSPEIRPKIERCIEVFQKSLANSDQEISKADSNMVEAVNVVAIEQAKREAEEQARKERKQQRDLIFSDAVLELKSIKEHLFSKIETHAKEVMIKNRSNMEIRAGRATLFFDTTINSNNIRGIRRSDHQEPYSSEDGGWGAHKRQSCWDLIAFTKISLEQMVGFVSYNRCANIVFGRPDDKSDYRWFEMAFWSTSQVEERRANPFCLDYVWEIDAIFAPVYGVNNLAHKPKPIDGEDENAFLGYWLSIFAQAMIGKLQPPVRMPMDR